MSIAQIILLILVAYSIILVVRRVVKKQSSIREILIWIIFWLVGAILIIKPDFSQRFASMLGIGRGVDLIIYIAIILSFMMQYELLTRQQNLEQLLTKLAREIALSNVIDNTKNTDGSKPLDTLGASSNNIKK